MGIRPPVNRVDSVLLELPYEGSFVIFLSLSLSLSLSPLPLSSVPVAFRSLRNHSLTSFSPPLPISLVSVDANFVKRWQLACEKDIAHVVVMPNVTREKVDIFVADFLKSIATHGRFKEVGEGSPLALLSDPAWEAAERRRNFTRQ